MSRPIPTHKSISLRKIFFFCKIIQAQNHHEGNNKIDFLQNGQKFQALLRVINVIIEVQ